MKEQICHMHTGPASLLHNHLTIGGGAGRDDRRCRHKKKFLIQYVFSKTFSEEAEKDKET